MDMNAASRGLPRADNALTGCPAETAGTPLVRLRCCWEEAGGGALSFFGHSLTSAPFQLHGPWRLLSELGRGACGYEMARPIHAMRHTTDHAHGERCQARAGPSLLSFGQSVHVV